MKQATAQTFTVVIGLEEIIGKDLEQFLDLIAEETGHPLLEDISYHVAGEQNGNIVLSVTGYVNPEYEEYDKA